MSDNPYQAPEEHDDHQLPPKQASILRMVLSHTVLFVGSLIFVLYAHDRETWIMRLSCGIAVAIAVWSFSELAKVGYGSPPGTSNNALSEDDGSER